MTQHRIRGALDNDEEASGQPLHEAITPCALSPPCLKIVIIPQVMNPFTGR